MFLLFELVENLTLILTSRPYSKNNNLNYGKFII